MTSVAKLLINLVEVYHRVLPCTHTDNLTGYSIGTYYLKCCLGDNLVCEDVGKNRRRFGRNGILKKLLIR